jgi:hypothetical protein
LRAALTATGECLRRGPYRGYGDGAARTAKASVSAMNKVFIGSPQKRMTIRDYPALRKSKYNCND